jgi:hypothetical protein
MKINHYLRMLLMAIFSLTTLIAPATGSKIIVTGVITDDQTKETLIGASVKVKDKAIGTIADVNGKFQLELESTGQKITLEISYTGYETRDGKRSCGIGIKNSGTHSGITCYD